MKEFGKRTAAITGKVLNIGESGSALSYFVDGASEICIALGEHVMDRCIEDSLNIVANALVDASADAQARLRELRDRTNDISSTD